MDFVVDTLLLWGMYSVYIEETMKFINKTQIEIINLEDYSDHERIHAEKVFHKNAVGGFAGFLENFSTVQSQFLIAEQYEYLSSGPISLFFI